MTLLYTLISLLLHIYSKLICPNTRAASFFRPAKWLSSGKFWPLHFFLSLASSIIPHHICSLLPSQSLSIQFPPQFFKHPPSAIFSSFSLHPCPPLTKFRIQPFGGPHSSDPLSEVHGSSWSWKSPLVLDVVQMPCGISIISTRWKKAGAKSGYVQGAQLWKRYWNELWMRLTRLG